MKIELKNIFNGRTYTHKVKITTQHPNSSYNQPVMVFPDGRCCNAETWLLGCGRVITATAKESEMFAKWHNNLMAFAGMGDY